MVADAEHVFMCLFAICRSFLVKCLFMPFAFSLLDYFFQFLDYFIVVHLQLSAFSPPLYPTPTKPSSLPGFHPPPWFCPCVLDSSSWKPLSPLSPPPSPLAIVRLFLTSMSLAIFCLLFSSVDYVPVKGEIIRYLSLTAWIISLSIMLSSSIHAVAKGISHQQMSGSKNYGTFTQWNSTQQRERRQLLLKLHLISFYK